MASSAGSDLFRAWLDQEVKAAQGAQGATAAAASRITDAMRKNLEGEWNKLKTSLEKSGSAEISGLCGDVDERVRVGGGSVVARKEYLKNICKGIAEIRYFMSGVETKRYTGIMGRGTDEDEDPVITTLDGAKAYPRCIVGMLAMSELYGDHCHLEEIIQHISPEVQRKLGGTHQTRGAKLDACGDIKTEDLKFGRTVLHNAIKDWVKGERGKGKKDGVMRVGYVWGWRDEVCSRTRRDQPHVQELRKENAQHMTSFLGVGKVNDRKAIMDELMNDKEIITVQDIQNVLQESMSNGGTANVDTIMNKVGEKIKKNEADVCMKEKSKSFCERLRCAKQHWELNNKQQGDFWSNNVEKKLEKLITSTTVDNGGTGGAYCNGNFTNNANKEACKHMAALLHEMYETQSSGNDKYSEQIIQCLLLKAYANKLKEQAKNKGYCDIEKGLKKAFDQSSTIMNTSGQCQTPNDKTCFECKWENDDTTKDGLDNCTIPNGPSQEKVLEKVVKLFKENKQTKEDEVHKTLTDFNNKNPLCERFQCLAAKGQDQKGNDTFWTTDVKELWQELSQAMTKTHGTSINGECNQMDGGRTPTNPERKACNYLNTGFEALYNTTTTPSSSVNGKLLSNPSLRQTMGCFLLHSYAKYMKDRAVCDIEKGIQKAFTLWGDPNEKASDTCKVNGKELCVPCHWQESDDKWENCSISTSGQNTTEVKDKLNDIVKKEDEAVKKATDAMNELTLCERVQCVGKRWLKEIRNKTSDPLTEADWDQVWEEAKSQLTELSGGIEKNKKETEVTKHCSMDESKGKEACLLIAAGLKSLYDIPVNGTDPNDAVKASFQRTMRCVLLNAIADKLQDDNFPCRDEKNVAAGITAAFKNSETIMGKGDGCQNGNVTCFKCDRVSLKDLTNCKVGENKDKELKNKVEEVLNDDNYGAKEEMKKIEAQAIKDICKPCEEDKNGEKCKRFECIVKKWEERNKTKVNGTVTWDDMKGDFGTELESLLNDMKDTTNQTTAALHCNNTNWKDNDAHGFANKTACQLVARGLQHISKIQLEYSDTAKPGTGQDKDPYDKQEYKQLVACLMLKAVVQKMKEDSKICDIDIGISAAFAKAGKIKSDHCKNGKPCIECKLTDEFDNCTIGNDKVKNKLDSLLTVEKKTNVDQTLEPITKTKGNIGTLCDRLQCLASRVQLTQGRHNAVSRIKGAGIKREGIEVIEREGIKGRKKERKLQIPGKPCEQDKDICNRLTCVMGKWEKNRSLAVGSTPWEKSGTQRNQLKDDFNWRLGELLDGMSKNQNDVSQHCTNGTWGNDAHGRANETACKLVVAGLQHISSIKHEYDRTKDANPFDHQDIRQVLSCLWLKRIVEEMKKRSTICDISKGIEAGSKAWNDIKKAHCTKQPCIDCNLNDINYGTCKIGSDDVQVKDKLEPLLTGREDKVKTAFTPITTTGGNAGPSLCDRLQCLSSRVHALAASDGPLKSSAKTFWKKGGELEQLWKELSQAMTTKGTGDNGDCSKVDGDRTPTDPERKACNYLHAGLKHLYTTTAKPLSSTGDNKLLSNPPLRRTMGCFLLHAYAKHMKDKANCLVESGIKRAFGSWEPSKKVICNGPESCVPCYWNEGDYDNCQITKNGTTKDKTLAKNKLEQVKDKITETSTETLTNINEMKNLCDYIKCAAPRWFKNGMKGTTNKTWCDFWDKAVKEALTKMFDQISQNGKDKTNSACNDFGDGNEHSVERKACNHITAGLKYISEAEGVANGGTQIATAKADDKFFKQTMMCAALNLYADKIKKQTETSCPIGEDKIRAMFEAGNGSNTTSSTSCPTGGSGNNVCFTCERNENFSSCNLLVDKDLIATASSGGSSPCNNNDNDKDKVPKQMNNLLEDNSINTKMEPTLKEINEMTTFCTQLQCAARKWNLATKGKKETPSWNDINTVVEEELKKLLKKITNDGNWNEVATYCTGDIGSSKDDTPGEKKAKQKACKLFALGLKHISNINEGDDATKSLKKTMMCAALNLYADQLIDKANDQCPLDGTKLKEAIKYAFEEGNATMKNGGTSCSGGSNGTNYCFVCKRHDNFPNCQIGNNPNDKVKDKMTILLNNEDQSNTASNNNQEKTLEKINKIELFCTQVQCAIKQKLRSQHKLQNGIPSWSDIDSDAKGVLAQLLEQMVQGRNQAAVNQYCNDEAKWSTFGHKGKHTNKEACLLFAAGLEHIYTHGNGHTMGQFKGPSFEQTMGCLFLKEYAEQLKKMAEIQKKYKVHPDCSVHSGIEHAFGKSKDIMKNVLSKCINGTNGISCFECKIDQDYDDCSISNDNVGSEVNKLFEDKQNKDHMEETLSNTVCPILLTDILTPFLPLAPVSIGLSAMAYYLWKYFGPLGKGGGRFRRSPVEIPGPSVQEQVLDHVEEAGPHEYRLVKERKRRSAPTRTKRSGRVNRRTIIEIHFEVLDECQKGDTQSNQKDFLELLVQEFMGSEFMEEEQVLKEEVLMEEVLMEEVPMERVPIEEVPSLGSVFMV
ncbi:SICAvar, type I [Plasmodium knowlesi strain H]|uniref:SICAvar, type I n=1 Tax=Plasmodium knowlesi (strain H) TaxID=5851 RepID=A0A679KX20_PLAKH|nr:SICAvar, type I [Plasmodium knowlesi strain H]CAA9988181.1 SICAvar, type I [Plasmodium knowlesi strain H]VVS77655.1 SICAvar, type I [Plasmodium knowlesi strain H]